MVKKVTITVDDTLLNRIDDYADKLGLNRSAFMSLASAKYLQAEDRLPLVREYLQTFRKLTGSAIAGDISPEEYSELLDVTKSEFKSVLK